MDVSYCRLLEINPDYLVDFICDIGKNGPVAGDYLRPLADEIVEEVAEDIYTSSDRDNWTADDIRLAVGRVLCKRLGVEI